MQLALLDEVGGSGPQHDDGSGLVGPAEVAPDHPELGLGDDETKDKHGDGDQQTLGHRLLGQVQEIRHDEAGAAKRGVTRGDGQDHHAEDGQDAANGAEQAGGDFVYHRRGTAACQSSVERFSAVVEGETQGAPDEGDDAFTDHGAVENEAAGFFVLHAARHQRGLGGVEAGHSTTGDGDEEQRPERQLGRVQVGEVHPCVVEALAGDDEADDEADRHEYQQCAEDGVEAADDLVDGHYGRQDVVGEDGHDPVDQIGGGQVGQQARRAQHENHAHQHQQDYGEQVHEVLGGVAQVLTDHGRHRGALGAYRQHAGEVVVYRTGEDAAKHDPQHGDRTIQGTQDGAEDGADAGDVEQLDQIDFLVRHGDIVNPVRHGDGGGFQLGFRAKYPFDEFAVYEIAGYEQADA